MPFSTPTSSSKAADSGVPRASGMGSRVTRIARLAGAGVVATVLLACGKSPSGAQSGTLPALDGIVLSMGSVSERVSQISGATLSQVSGISQVNRAVMAMDGMTQANADLVEDIKHTGRALTADADTLMRQVAFFRLPPQEGHHGSPHDAGLSSAMTHLSRAAA